MNRRYLLVVLDRSGGRVQSLYMTLFNLTERKFTFGLSSYSRCYTRVWLVNTMAKPLNANIQQ
jgi:hypothetical protein